MNDPVLNQSSFGAGSISVAADNDALLAVDAPPATEAQSVLLCVHHLTLAAAYFEATPTDLKFLRDAIVQIFDEGRAVAANAFIDALDAHYTKLAPSNAFINLEAEDE